MQFKNICQFFLHFKNARFSHFITGILSRSNELRNIESEYKMDGKMLNALLRDAVQF